MNVVNYQIELEKLIGRLGGERPSLLLHSCCGPCSSYCIWYLRQHFDITVFYYNPNITENEEYEFRKSEQIRLINEFNSEEGAPIVKIASAPYDPDSFFEISKGLEDCPERGARCAKCFRLRLEETAKEAAKQNFDYFATTLTLSPLKNAELINNIGFEVAKESGSVYLPSDFKKKEGYKKSIELSKEHNLYRQDYCGCIYSKRDRKE